MTTYPLVASSSLPQNKIRENQPPHPSPKRKLDLLGALFHWLLRFLFLTVFILIVYTYNWLHEIWYLLFTGVLLILLIRCEVHSKVQIYFGNDSPWLALLTEKILKHWTLLKIEVCTPKIESRKCWLCYESSTFGKTQEISWGGIGNFLGNTLENDVNTWKIHEKLMKISVEKKLGFVQYHHARKKKKERRWRL
jgi:hypothetical protein